MRYRREVRNDVMNDSSYLSQEMAVTKESNEMLQYAHFRPSVDGYSQVTTLYTDCTESIAIGAATPEQAVDTFQSELTRMVGEDKVTVK